MWRFFPLLLAACALDNHTDHDAGSLDFQIGAIPFRVSSGGTRPGALYLTDQPDACLAVTQTPVGRATIFALRLSGPSPVTLMPKQGEITLLTGGKVESTYDVADGTASFTANEDGTTTIDALDVGFTDTQDRLHLTGLTIPSCK